MSDWIIKVENLGKRYHLRHQQERQRYVALRDVIADRFKRLFRSSNAAFPGTEDFWALKDVSFEIERGAVLGIIGRNGAGKSTLLKILSRITESTEGRVRLRGRVASLLEVGTGFHPELTGRENIYLNGAILGMTRAEIRRKYDEIVAFAEVEKFLDTPVKRYSSGMYVRLAFAVAAHLEPEILVVDEVLAVGDATFQKKCLGKMGEVGKEGRTVLFVSHNMQAVRTLCNRGLLLAQGRLVSDATASEAVELYETQMNGSVSSTWERPAYRRRISLSLESVGVALEGQQPNLTLVVRTRLRSYGPHKPAFIAIDILDAAGCAIMQAIPTLEGFMEPQATEHEVVTKVELPPLVPSVYSVTVWIGPHNMETLDLVVGCAAFEINQSPTPNRTFPHHRDHGCIVPRSWLASPTKP